MASSGDRYRTIEAARLGLYSDPEAKPPPIIAVGPIAWIRDNLFSTPLDAILTIISTLILVSISVTVMTWAINDANWLVVTRNLRQFMAGTYPIQEIWRLQVVVLAVAFAMGFTWYAYSGKANYKLFGIIGAIVAFTAIIPPIVNAIVPPASTYLAVGDTNIVSGTVTERPIQEVAFVGQEGEVIEIVFAPEANSESSLTSAAGFFDRATNAIINNSRNRMTTQDQITRIERDLAGDLLTQNQRDRLIAQLGGLTVLPPVSETYEINSASVSVEILDGMTMETLATATLSPTDPPFTFTLPAEGWYIFRKSVISEAEETPVALLKTTGIYPLIERNITRPLATGGSERVTQYVRLTDDYEIEVARPRIDGQDVPLLFITDHQYRGERPFADYMRLAGAPFLNQLSRAFIPMLLLAVVGYVSAAGLVRFGHRPQRERRQNESPKQPAQSAANWLWAVILIVGFALIYGINNLDPLRASLLIAQFVWVGWMFFAGIHNNRAWGRPLIGLLLVIGAATAVIAERLNENITIGGIAGLLIWLIVGYYAARMGANRRGSWSTQIARRALIVTSVLWAIAVIVPNLILSSTAAGSQLLPLTETRGWGGFLLTSLLTIVAIIASFPLGVALALGRRSALPVVRVVCILYIELVRGVPLITVLFMAQLLVPLVNPALANVDNVFRAMVGLTLFSAAYLAENVRGGLQSVPHGQEEAAKAVGLNSFQITLLITLPQALRAVIPALVGQCIALFKDTSLVALVGLIDLTGTARTTIAQPEFVGLQGEVYLFISVIYFIVSYMMAYVSRRIEFSGSGAANRRSV